MARKTFRDLVSPSEEQMAIHANLLAEKLKAIERGDAKGLFDGIGTATPVNLSGRPYSAHNAMAMKLMAEKQGYEVPVWVTYQRLTFATYQKDPTKGPMPIRDDNGQEFPPVMVNKGEKAMPVFLTVYSVVNNDTKEKIPYEEYQKMWEEDKKNFTVTPKQLAYHVYNIDQTNMKEARPELYAALKEQALHKPERQLGDLVSVKELDLITEQQNWIVPFVSGYSDEAEYLSGLDGSPKIMIPSKEDITDKEKYAGELLWAMALSASVKRGNSELGARTALETEIAAAIQANELGLNIPLQLPNVVGVYYKLASRSATEVQEVLQEAKKTSNKIEEAISEARKEIAQQNSARYGGVVSPNEDIQDFKKGLDDATKAMYRDILDKFSPNRETVGVITLYKIVPGSYEVYGEDTTKLANITQGALTNQLKTANGLTRVSIADEQIEYIVRDALKAGVRIGVSNQMAEAGYNVLTMPRERDIRGKDYGPELKTLGTYDIPIWAERYIKAHAMNDKDMLDWGTRGMTKEQISMAENFLKSHDLTYFTYEENAGGRVKNNNFPDPTFVSKKDSSWPVDRQGVDTVRLTFKSALEREYSYKELKNSFPSQLFSEHLETNAFKHKDGVVAIRAFYDGHSLGAKRLTQEDNAAYRRMNDVEKREFVRTMAPKMFASDIKNLGRVKERTMGM